MTSAKRLIESIEHLMGRSMKLNEFQLKGNRLRKYQERSDTEFMLVDPDKAAAEWVKKYGQRRAISRARSEIRAANPRKKDKLRMVLQSIYKLIRRSAKNSIGRPSNA